MLLKEYVLFSPQKTTFCKFNVNFQTREAYQTRVANTPKATTVYCATEVWR